MNKEHKPYNDVMGQALDHFDKLAQHRDENLRKIDVWYWRMNLLIIGLFFMVVFSPWFVWFFWRWYE